MSYSKYLCSECGGMLDKQRVKTPQAPVCIKCHKEKEKDRYRLKKLKML